MSEIEAPALFDNDTHWLAETLQMVNWGGFHGWNPVPFASGATLLSGPSGSGKSTLLDAYLALMMPSDAPFNGASNDAIAGRARSADQRNVISYLRGKTDDTRESGTGQLREKVLRGADSATWGAVALTFLAPTGDRFTAARLYFVPRGATKIADITMKLVTYDGYLDLRTVEELAAGKFDKRELQTRVPGINVHDSYQRFTQVLFTKLGIGVSGDGVKALRLLARIQGGHQVRSVDDLYKSLVLEPPATFEAAERAVEHFADLETSYEAMLTSADKERVLSRLPDLRTEFTTAQAAAELIDTFGVHREGDSPFKLWSLGVLGGLLDAAGQDNRVAHAAARRQFADSAEEETNLAGMLREIESAQDDAGGSTLKRIDEEVDRLGRSREESLANRQRFDANTKMLGYVVADGEQFEAAAREAELFLGSSDQNRTTLRQEQDRVREARWPLLREQAELREEKRSLDGRDGRVPRDMHEARLQIAKAAGMDAKDLSFVAELIDVKPEESPWRKAIEVCLFGVARVLLIDERHLERVSHAIDPLRLGVRINFEGVPLGEHQEVAGDRQLISGKLAYKASAYSGWVQTRIQVESIDARCVDSPAELSGRGRRVTVHGQMRSGKSGAHGEYRSPSIIGFSSVERVAEIDARLVELEVELAGFDRVLADLERQEHHLSDLQSAYQYVVATSWQHIDVDSLDSQIAGLGSQRQRIVEASDTLRALQEEENRVQAQLQDARSRKYGADSELRALDARYLELVERKDTVTDELVRIEGEQAVTIDEAQQAHLTAEFGRVGKLDDLGSLPDGLARLKDRLAERSKEERDKIRRAADAMTGIFTTYQDRWPDPDLGTALISYDGYLDILDGIRSTGLHQRRQEWSRRLAEWSGQDLVPLAGAFESSIEDIEARLEPVNAILAGLEFGAHRRRLKIDLRRLRVDEIVKFQRELRLLSSGSTTELPDAEIEARFKRLRKFIALLRAADRDGKPSSSRDYFLDVRKHVVITAVALDDQGVERASYASLGGKSGGETQELVAFIVGAALRYQLGDADSTRPRFAPVFLDEGFVKSDAEFAGRAVQAWQGLRFQLIIGAPLDKVTALEPYMEKVLAINKSSNSFSHISELAVRVA